MEITLVSSNVFKLKFKQATYIAALNEQALSSVAKATEGDGVLVAQRLSTYDFPKVQNIRLFIDGAGEYELQGVKVNAVSVKDSTVYFVAGDGVTVMIGSSAVGTFDKKKEVQVAAIFAEGPLQETLVTDLAPSYLVFTGEKAVETAKEFGKEAVTNSSKVVIIKDKLPAEMEVVVLQ